MPDGFDLVRRVAELMAGYAAPWGISGGWAQDLSRGRVTRPHRDVDVAVLRGDQALLWEYLSSRGWFLEIAYEGKLAPWAEGEVIEPPLRTVWASKQAFDPSFLDVALEEGAAFVPVAGVPVLAQTVRRRWPVGHASDGERLTLTLVTMAGLPGTGKSTIAGALARETGFCLLELDRIEAPILRRFSGDALGWGGYEILTALIEDHLALGHSVIADCVCWTRELRREWAELAGRAGAAFRAIEVVCPDEAAHRRRVAQRPDISWQRIEEARTLYEAWDTPRLVLDSTQPLAGLVAQAAAYVRTHPPS